MAGNTEGLPQSEAETASSWRRDPEYWTIGQLGTTTGIYGGVSVGVTLWLLSKVPTQELGRRVQPWQAIQRVYRNPKQRQ